jgi:hypothetical protein
MMSQRLRLKLYESRSCGDCRACCTTERVLELQKEPGVSCEFLRLELGPGCSRYETRPNGCRQWACVWRSGSNLLTEGERPDEIGVIFDSDARGILYAKETEPGGFKKAEAVLVRLAKRRVVVLTSADGKEGIAFGPSEAVLKYQRRVAEESDDAAE